MCHIHDNLFHQFMPHFIYLEMVYVISDEVMKYLLNTSVCVCDIC